MSLRDRSTNEKIDIPNRSADFVRGNEAELAKVYLLINLIRFYYYIAIAHMKK